MLSASSTTKTTRETPRTDRYSSPMPDIASSTPDHPLLPQVTEALATVQDPEIKRPLTEIGMVESVSISEAGHVEVRLLLTTAGCPLKATLTTDTTEAVSAVPGVTGVSVDLGVMNDEQRNELKTLLRGGVAEREIPFGKPDNLTKVIAVTSGKGGVGKSSVTVNLARALAAAGHKVGILDADIYGHSIPPMLGIADSHPTMVDDLIMPVPAHDMKVMSIGMMKARRDQVVAWRGPILDRALTQMLADVHWGDLDFLILDLPPGTGDVAISIGQKLPGAEVVVVTTPQQAAAEVAERAGTMAAMLNQRVIGVVENMSYLETTCPHCSQAHRVNLFGAGGGAEVAANLSRQLGYDVPLLGEVPIDTRVRSAGDDGVPVVDGAADIAASEAFRGIADTIGSRGRGLAGRQLGLSPL